jgi:hypothetical protein
MRGEVKRIVKLDEIEQGLAITVLNDKRTELLREDKPTDMVDDLLLKIIDAPSRKFRKARGRNEAR